MRRLQVMLPPRLIEDLQQIAKARGIGTGTLVRMLLLASIERRNAA